MEKFNSKDNFLYPKTSYRGLFTPQNLVFNANLQEFALRVSFIAGLHTGGKLTSTEAYEKINQLWQELNTSQKFLLANHFEDDGD
ncbi:MAG: hypothetical protein IM550_08645 [Microcystis sp. M54BS1]|jgi:hypothetical protein|uniref:Isopropylmalate/homocitrate/citramalate synthases n=7 Tax=Microcystis TaxID=1125 RepID=A0A0A1W053_MICAE|nr:MULTISPECIES: hypothetical protein [Microcystis]MBE5228618.1 hypothetical protein [Microcystis aeruginosa PMC 728.11]MCA2539291.1 hypothetical protein [Microcystis sp. M54BS1]MCA2596433.1 hypothetical protein [Microcystis sp. M38BS1]MCA2609754.1 hypothetical protein [Microcystis sp. M27BS1]MDY7047150.1 hypothetical protein [Microcystis panniformis WG22]NCQ91281.1 hypothetical protein [Microcystis aeruginosa LG13-13]NCR04485.1 hypothetical protein [Microcystis aeruginosa LG13-03]NCR53832.